MKKIGKRLRTGGMTGEGEPFLVPRWSGKEGVFEDGS